MLASVFTALVALSASVLAATTPTTFNDTSNPIFTPNNGHIVPVGVPYRITWGPTESGTVSIILLRGPSSNILPLYPIVENIPNTGSYTWTPRTDLVADVTHYGLQIIIDANGQYQYSTQFGISNPNVVSSSSSSASVAPTSSSAPVSSYPATTSEPTTTSYATVYETTKSYVTSLVTVVTSSSSAAASTLSSIPAPYPIPSGNATYVPSGPGVPSPTGPAPLPSATGAASSIKVASGLLVGVAGVVAMLL